MWYVVPGFLLSSGFDIYSSLAMTAIVLSGVHSIQYLWISSYYKKREDPTGKLLPYLTKPTLAGAAGLGVMLIFFSPSVLGSVPYDSGLALLAASALNVHHFAIDGVIWKLRDGAVARALLGATSDNAAADAIPTWPRWLGWTLPLVYLLGAATLVASAVFVWESAILENADTDRYEVATERLRWIGRDSAFARTQLAVRLTNEGKHRRALEEIDRSLALLPNPETWMIKGQLHKKDRYWTAALEAFEAALQLDPGHYEAQASRREALRNLERWR
jgi:tetratricopeptide (TPR) repeat protein